MLSILFSVTFVIHDVRAASNPLAKMPQKTELMEKTRRYKGCDYLTPKYKTKVVMTAKSTNTKIVKVKAYNYKSSEGKYYSGYEVYPVGPGKASIQVTAKVGGKTYKKTCACTCYKYVNPFKSLKLGAKGYQDKYEKETVFTTNQKYLSGKLLYQLKADYSITDIWVSWEKKNEDGTIDFGSKKIKNRAKLPAYTTSLSMAVKNKKTKKDRKSVV